LFYKVYNLFIYLQSLLIFLLLRAAKVVRGREQVQLFQRDSLSSSRSFSPTHTHARKHTLFTSLLIELSATLCSISLELSPMATINLPTRMSLPNPDPIMASDRLAASKYLSDFVFQSEVPRRKCVRKQIRSMSITEQGQSGRLTSPNGALGAVSFAFFLFLYLGFWVVVDF
jgi:hypothetical protein